MNKRLVVFASGSGSNFQALLDTLAAGNYPIVCVGLCTDRPECGAETIAIKRGIPVFRIRRGEYSDYSAYVDAMSSILEKLQPDLMVLAGYLKKIPNEIVRQWPLKIINIHPSLLPKFGGKHFYGIHVHQAVLEAQEEVSGCTVHYIDEHYDHGDIIQQAHTPILTDDTPESLQQRVLSLEHRLLPEIVIQLLTDPIHHGE